MLLFLAFLEDIALAKSWSMTGAFPQPALMGSCLTVSHTCLPCLSSRHVSLCVPCVIEGSEDAVWLWTSFTSIEVTDGWILHWVVWILWARRGKNETNMKVCWQANGNLNCNQQTVLVGDCNTNYLLIYLWTGCELEKIQLFIQTEIMFCVARQVMQSAYCALARWLNNKNECT